MRFNCTIKLNGEDYEVEANCVEDSDDSGRTWVEVELLSNYDELLKLKSEEWIHNEVAEAYMSQDFGGPDYD